MDAGGVVDVDCDDGVRLVCRRGGWTGGIRPELSIPDDMVEPNGDGTGFLLRRVGVYGGVMLLQHSQLLVNPLSLSTPVLSIVLVGHGHAMPGARIKPVVTRDRRLGADFSMG